MLIEEDKLFFIFIAREFDETQERLEIDTLGECAILRQPKKFFTTQIKLKTKLL